MIVSNGMPFAPQALAEVTPISSATGYFYADQGIELLNRFAYFGEMYRSQPWVYAIVSKLAKAGARLDFNVWDHSGDHKVRDNDSDYAKFWLNPCPTMPRYRFWNWTFSTRDIYGEAFWVKQRAKGFRTADKRDQDFGPVVGLHPMHPSRTVVQRDKDTGRITYRFTLGVASAGLLEVDEAEVVPFLDYNPNDLMRGLSPLEALRTTLFSEDASRRAIESWWTRGARPSLMISAPGALSQKAYDRLSSTVNSTHGGADRMGGTLVLEEGAKPIPVQLSAEEMQYIQSRMISREEACGVYDMPPPVVHILDKATFSNITEQMRSMYRDTMAPRLEDVESIIDTYLTPDFADPSLCEGRFALDEVLRGDFETRATAVGTLIEKGVMKPAEARPLFDLDDAGPVADKLYANSALQELGTPATRITVTDRTGVATPGEEAAASAANNQVAAEIDDQAGSRNGATPPVKSPSIRSRNRTERRAAQRRGAWSKEDTEESV